MTVSPLHRAALPDDFDEFYRQYFVRVLVLIGRHFPACDAEEIAQETMVRCYSTYDTIDPGRDPWSYVSSVARNAAIDSLRRTRRLVSTDELPEAPRDVVDQTYDAVLDLELRRTLRDALLRLRAADRQLLVDHELEGMAYTEMAELRDMTPNALRQKVFRARGRLATELRRVGASLGVLPVAVHHRLGRLGRRWSDFSYAAGPVGASAFGALAVAAVVGTFAAAPVPPATMAAPPATAGAPALKRLAPRPRPASAPVSAATPRRASRPAPAAVRPAGPLPRPVPGGEGPALPLVKVKSEGDPLGNPRGPGSTGFRVPTPVGDVGLEMNYETTPGYIVLCEYGVVSCPPPE